MSTLIDVRSGDAQFTAVVVHSGTQTLTHSSNEEHARIIIEPNAEMKAKNTFISLAVMQSILCASFDWFDFRHIAIWSNDVHDGAHRNRLHAINMHERMEHSIRLHETQQNGILFLSFVWRAFDRQCWCLYHQQMLSPFGVAPRREVRLSAENTIFSFLAHTKELNNKLSVGIDRPTIETNVEREREKKTRGRKKHRHNASHRNR